MAKDKKIQWHPAFYGAMHLEFKGIAYAYLYKSQETHVNEIPLEEITLTFIRERKPINLFKKLLSEKFIIEEKWAGIYYIIREGSICIQIVVTKELSKENHIWLNALSGRLNEANIEELILTTKALEHEDEKLYADSLWEAVTRANKKIVRKVREDDDMCRALAEIMKPELDEAFGNGFNNGFNDGFNDGFTDGVNQGKNDGKILVFKNMIKDGMPRELAQKYTELSDQLVEEVLAEVL